MQTLKLDLIVLIVKFTFWALTLLVGVLLVRKVAKRSKELDTDDFHEIIDILLAMKWQWGVYLFWAVLLVFLTSSISVYQPKTYVKQPPPIFESKSLVIEVKPSTDEKTVEEKWEEKKKANDEQNKKAVEEFKKLPPQQK